MTQTQELQKPSASSWGNQNVRALSSRTPPEAKFREKNRSGGFFIRSTFAGGMAGCAVPTRPPLPVDDSNLCRRKH